MNLNDIIALAKSGFSVADVKELMALDTNTTTTAEVENVQVEEVPKQEVQNTTANTEEKEVLNYKDMYDELAKKNEELEKQVKALQEHNIRKTTSAEPTEDFATTFGDFARSFM